MPTPIDPVPVRPSLSLVPPPLAVSPTPDSEPRAERPRFRRLVVFTGKIS